MKDEAIVIAGYARTPLGSFQGAFANVQATELGAAAIKAAVERSHVRPDKIERVYMGCVLSAGLGQAPARQAALRAGLPFSAQATTVNKMCGSAMQAVILACEALASRSIDVTVAGGMESMTNAPYLLPKFRGGARIGHDRVIDHLMLDGLEDAYEPGKPMGAFAEVAARDFGFDREAQDRYAIRSLERATAAIASGAFVREIAPVMVRQRGTETLVETDEQPAKSRIDRIAHLKPAFAANGTITAANASSISDGAAALVITRAEPAAALGMPVIAAIRSTAAHAQEPAHFTTAPVPAIRRAVEKAGWTMDDVDLFEINEAFAVVAMIAAQELAIPSAKLNVNGGATALGHPIGASGARIIATLISALEARKLKRGVAALCIGGGEATAVTIELI